MDKYFNICSDCGAHLDPGEKCDCGKIEVGVDLLWRPRFSFLHEWCRGLGFTVPEKDTRYYLKKYEKERKNELEK